MQEYLFLLKLTTMKNMNLIIKLKAYFDFIQRFNQCHIHKIFGHIAGNFLTLKGRGTTLLKMSSLVSQNGYFLHSKVWFSTFKALDLPNLGTPSICKGGGQHVS